MSFTSVFHPTSWSKLPKQHAWISIAISILLIAFGIMAIVLPTAMSYSVVLVSSWLLMFAGIAQLFHVFRCRGIGHALWKAVVALLYIVTGFYLRLNLTAGLVAITFVLAAFFFSQGVVDLIAYMRIRKLERSGWMLIDAFVVLALGVMIWRHWPSNSFWVIGTLVGINMIVTGFTRLMLTAALRPLS